MPTPSEHKTVQNRILAYAKAIGWTIVPREEVERRRGFDPDAPPAASAKNRSLFFDGVLDAKVREFNQRYAEAEGALPGAPKAHNNIAQGEALGPGTTRI